jgi:hypothetical protein
MAGYGAGGYGLGQYGTGEEPAQTTGQVVLSVTVNVVVVAAASCPTVLGAAAGRPGGPQ